MDIKGIKEKVISYLRDVQSEAHKVIWPGKQYITAATIIVFVIVFLVVVFIMLIDFGFAKFFAQFSGTRAR